jgi:hypothetical protein
VSKSGKEELGDDVNIILLFLEDLGRGNWLCDLFQEDRPKDALLWLMAPILEDGC